MTKCFEKGPERVYKFGIICKDYKVIPHMYAHVIAKAAFSSQSRTLNVGLVKFKPCGLLFGRSGLI